MGIRKSQDKKGSYFMNGHTGHKFYYQPHSIKSIKLAYDKARTQQKAIFSSGWKSKKK